MSEFIYSKVKFSDLNHFRSKVFKESKKRVRASKTDVERYRSFLETSYTKVLKQQLGISGGRVYHGNKARFGGDGSRSTYSNLGVDTRALLKSARGTTSVRLERDTTSGRVNVRYTIKNSETVRNNGFMYGEYIAKGRKAGTINIDAIIQWLRHKNIKLRPPTNRDAIAYNKGKLSERELRSKVAFLICSKAKASRKPAVIPDWNNLSKNQRFKRMFDEEIKKEGRTHRNRIRRGIMRNFNKK